MRQEHVGPVAVTGIVLAAGTSSRLGRPKQLLHLAGKHVVRHVVDAALAAPLGEVLVVVGHRGAEVARALPTDERLRLVENPRFAAGQSTSLVAGLDAAGPEADAAVVLLGDQPGVRPEAIGAVVEAFARGAGPFVQAGYEGGPGHPTLIARSVWSTVRSEVSGDEGARHVLSAHPEWRVTVQLPWPAPDDIDTEADYERVARLFRPPQA